MGQTSHRAKLKAIFKKFGFKYNQVIRFPCFLFEQSRSMRRVTITWQFSMHAVCLVAQSCGSLGPMDCSP